MATASFKRQWADGPLPLIESPLKKATAEGREQSPAEVTATEMSNVHNTFIRSLNAMLLQAPHLTTPKDQTDMTRFAYALCYLIHEHHDLEETLLFPLIEQAAGVPDLMETNVVQHSEFTPGFHAFYTYVNQMINGVAVWDAKKFVGQIESFAPVLTLHLTDEIKTLLELAKYDVDWAGIMKRVQEHGIAHVEKDHAVPIFMHSMDITYEDNVHLKGGKWPPIPWFGQFIFRLLYVPKHKGAWRFGSCDAYGRPQELPFAPLKAVKAPNGDVSS